MRDVSCYIKFKFTLNKLIGAGVILIVIFNSMLFVIENFVENPVHRARKGLTEIHKESQNAFLRETLCLLCGTL